MTTGAGDVIRLVGGDERPRIILTLTDEITGDPIDVSDPLTVVTIRLRKAGTETSLFNRVCAKDNGGADGIVSFDFTGGGLDIDPGAYEIEIVVDFNGEVQTVYDLLRVRLRSPFTV